jgi:hypothetical protein
LPQQLYIQWSDENRWWIKGCDAELTKMSSMTAKKLRKILSAQQDVQYNKKLTSG